MNLKPLPIGNQTFRKIIQDKQLYVDKTQYIYKLIHQPSGVYFLSRPRRFGKSLLISTLDEIFQGNKELFNGLWLYDSPYQWKQHPVIHIDFGRTQVHSAEDLKRYIKKMIKRLARQHQVEISDGNYIEQFDDLIFEIAQQNKVVILVDEYDKPILDSITDTAEAQRIQTVLKGFYGVIKAMDAYIRFVLLTGVSKFSRVGVFSGLNNLHDISMNNQYSAMLGITQDELESYFSDYLQLFTEERDGNLSDLKEQIREWYNGFCFSRRCQPVYNPFSLLLLFQEREFKNYWFESGTPTFLLKILKAQNYNLQQLETLHVPDLAFSTYEIEHLDIVPLLFQTGYLTIKGYNPKNRRYDLSYPNYEVEHAFLAHLLGTFSEVSKSSTANELGYLIAALQDADWERFFTVLNSFLAMIDYRLHIKQEKYYQTIFYLIFKLIGLEIHAEVRTNQGRIDAVIETDEAIFIFEFKLDGTAAEAIAQIKTKSYFEPYLLKEKDIYLAGVNFDMEKRTVVEWTVELMG